MRRTEGHETTSALAIPKSTLGIGIIGVSPVRGWAATAHIPALRALPKYEIRALSVHNAESARAIGEAFGGSAVFCEWPLGRDLEDARAMATLAAKQGVRTVAGLQARQAPAIEFVRQLLRDGYVGEVLSTTLVGLSIAGDVVGQPNAYMLDKTNGANLLTVPVG